MLSHAFHLNFLNNTDHPVISTAMSLRLPNLLRWNSYMEECIQSFETSSDSLPSDLVLGKWARLQRLKDDIAIRYEVEDAFAPSGSANIESDRSLSALEEQLDRWGEESNNSSGISPYILPDPFYD